MSFSKKQLIWLCRIFVKKIDTGFQGSHSVNFEKIESISFLMRAKYQIYKNVGLKNDYARVCGFEQPTGHFAEFFDMIKEKGIVIPMEINGRNGFYKVDKEKILQELIDDEFTRELEKVLDENSDFGFKFKI